MKLKPVLAFAALVGAGIAVLHRLETTRPAVGAAAEAALERSDPSEPDGVAGTSALELRGPLVLLRYAEAPGGPRGTLLQLQARDTRTHRGGEIVLEDVEAVWNDEESGEPRVTIRAGVGSMRLTESGQRYPIDFAEDVAEDRLVLEDVEIVLHRGAPVTPLTLEVGRLEGDINDRLFTSSDVATARGPGLFARGTGLLLDLVHGVVRFDADAELRFSDEQEGTATLRSVGKMHVLRGSDGGAEVVARDGASLRVLGRERAEVEARRINVIGARTSEGGAEGGGMRLSRLSADGEAVVVLPMGRFAGDRADLRVARGGDVRAELTGAPEAQLVLTSESEERTIELDVSGEGPLAVEAGAQRSFELGGPAVLTWDANRLVSEGGIRGWAGEDGLSFSTWDGVELTQPSARLETVALDLLVEREASPDRMVQLTTHDETLLVGEGKGGEPFELRAEEVVYRQEGGRWVVPLALGVDLRVASDPPLALEADRLEDLRVGAQTFVAEGDVRLARGEQRAAGERLVGLGPDHFTLDGSGAGRASLTAPRLHLEGERLERRGERFAARGNAAAQVARRGAFAELEADSLHGTLTVAPAADGGEVTTYDLRTEGDVTAVFESGERSGQASCGTLHAVFVEEVGPDGAPRSSRSLVEFDGGVRAEVTEGGGLAHRLSARAARFEQLAADGPWTGVARGGVRVARDSETRPSFLAEADVLTLDAEGEAHLTGLDGEVVRFDGVLPGGRYPFVLEAPAADVAPDRVRADDARIWVRSLSLLPGPQPELAVDAELVAEADSFSAVATEVLLAGGVRVTGIDEAGEDVALSSEFVRFEADEAGDDEAPAFRRMHVWGGFDFRYGEFLAARGDRMEARAATGRLRIEGSPARVAYGDWIQVADSLEFDLFLRIIVEASAGHVSPARPAATAE